MIPVDTNGKTAIAIARRLSDAASDLRPFRFALRSASGDNSGMKQVRSLAIALLAVFAAIPALHSLEKQPASIYHARRVALAARLNGGAAVLFAAYEPQM